MAINIIRHKVLDAELVISHKRKEVPFQNRYLITVKIELIRLKARSVKWMVHFYSPSSTFFFPKFNLLNLEEFLTLFAKYYLINKQILAMLDVSVDEITNSVYNSTERIVKFCDQAFNLCKKQQLYFINFEDLFIDATNINGYLPVDFTLFRQNPEEHDKLMKRILIDFEIKFKVDRNVLDLFNKVVNHACTCQEILRNAAKNAS